MAFVIGFIKFSASAFAWGHNGVILQCCMPFSSINRLISVLVNGGPLSLFTINGIPCVAKILSILGIMVVADVEWTISTLG